MAEPLLDKLTCRRLAEEFYARVDSNPVLRRVYSKSHHCAIDGLSNFLTQFFGGPHDYSKQRWSLSLYEAHLRFRIGREERDAWMTTMRATLAQFAIDASKRDALIGFFEQSSAFLVNRGERPAGKPSLGSELDAPWQEHLAIERAVAAVRAGHPDEATALAKSTCFQNDRSAFLSLLALMAASGNPTLLEFTVGQVKANPALVRERYTYSRTLLHDAARDGVLPLVNALLDAGADPNAVDDYGHTPLYAVGNSTDTGHSGAIVRALVNAGADVDAQDRIKRCTALHMAARRGNAKIAQALLDCGANLEIRDRLGETPLRRAVNCGKIEVAALLLARGADPQSKSSKGITPLQAARTGAMKQLLSAHN